MLYLSGDLSAEQTVAFEQRLAQSPQLADTLLSQSELICQVALIPNDQASPTTPELELTSSSKRFFAALLAIAASLAMLTTLWVNRPTGNDPNVALVSETNPDVSQEEVLIAQAWASTNAEIRFLDDEDEILTDSNADLLTNASLDDSSLSWVSAAIESGASVDG